MKTFRKEIEDLINKNSLEIASNTPDFILAEYLIECLKTFDKIVCKRDKWYCDMKMFSGLKTNVD